MSTLVLFSNHEFSGRGRKASIHFIAEEYVARGYHVHAVTVGRSLLSGIRNPRFRRPPASTGVGWQNGQNGIATKILSSPVHPFDAGGPLKNLITEPIVYGFGARLPKDVVRPLSEATRVIVDSGTAPLYLRVIRKHCQHAAIVFNCADLMKNINRRPSVLRAERDLAAVADLVRVPSPLMCGVLGDQCVYIPHGLDKASFENVASPYTTSRNIVSVGSTLHDARSLLSLATAAPDWKIHIFGTPPDDLLPGNIIQYGERPFHEIVPYIKHADVAIAAYDVGLSSAYMVQSSLKIIQYRYARLPILAPNTIPWQGADIHTYEPVNQSSMADALRRAASATRPGEPDNVLSWSDVVDRIEARLARPR